MKAEFSIEQIRKLVVKRPLIAYQAMPCIVEALDLARADEREKMKAEMEITEKL